MLAGTWKANLILVVVLLLALGCSSGTDNVDGDTGDGDTSDGDVADGDETDGDTSDGDVADGDATDGDVADGDVADGDASDGDVADGDAVDGDVEIDGDVDPDAEEELEPVECVAGDIAVRELPVVVDETFDLGPYVSNARTDAISILWRSETAGDTRVFIGDSAETLAEYTVVDEDVNVHEVEVSGLTANTRYFYKVQTGETASQVHSFYTAVERGQAFQFAVWGDNQNGPEIFTTVVAQIMQQNPYILVGVGDHVQAGSEQSLWKDQLFGPARALFHERSFYAAMGNHEQNSHFYYDYYSIPHAHGAEEDATYSFTYGNAFFLVVNTNSAFFPIGETQTPASQFIMDAVSSPEAKAATWRFALAHEPGYSEAWGNGSCTYEGLSIVRNWLLPLLAENKFHAYFSGHMHGYERGQTEGGLVDIITGGGGGGLDAWCLDWPQTTVAHYEHNFLKVTAGCDSLKIEALYPSGERFDWVELAADDYGTIVDEGPVEDLPAPTINSDTDQVPPTK